MHKHSQIRLWLFMVKLTGLKNHLQTILLPYTTRGLTGTLLQSVSELSVFKNDLHSKSCSVFSLKQEYALCCDKENNIPLPQMCEAIHVKILVLSA